MILFLQSKFQYLYEIKHCLILIFKQKIAIKLSIIIYEKHYYEKHKESWIKCPNCNKVLRNKSSLRVHIQCVHLKEGSTICNECGIKVRSKDGLRKHMKVVHQGLRAYPCELCSYRASSLTNLNMHRSKMHQKEKLSRNELNVMIQDGRHSFVKKLC